MNMDNIAHLIHRAGIPIKMSSHVKILNCNCNRPKMIHNVAEQSQAKDKCSWIVEYVLGTSSL